MSHRVFEIGSVEKNPAGEASGRKCVQFDVPYNDRQDTYRVTLSDEELENMYQKAVQSFLARRALSLLNHATLIKLPSPELPLFVWPSEIAFDIDSVAQMTAYVVTQSEVDENYHHGNLYVSRSHLTSSWEKNHYETLPPFETLSSDNY